MSTLYYYCTNNSLDDVAHCSEADVNATTAIFLFNHFWNNRLSFICQVDYDNCLVSSLSADNIIQPKTSVPSPNDDSDTDGEKYDNEVDEDNRQEIKLGDDCDNNNQLITNDIINNNEIIATNNLPEYGWFENQQFCWCRYYHCLQ